MIVTPESGLLLLPTIPAIYPATAANKNPAVKIIIKDKNAGKNKPDIIHTMKNIGIAIAALVMAMERAGRSSFVRILFTSETVVFVD